MRRVRWGVLSTAKIGIDVVIPAMQAGKHCEIIAIASRTLGKAEAAARELGIPRAYGTYEELLEAPDIEAVYIPLPNHQHVPWSIKALSAGKHVLCEKPIGLTAAEAHELLIAARQRPKLKAMEAFMYRHHPQWQRARQLVGGSAIGEVRTIQSFYSYYNADPGNIRNMAEIGGGGLMDIGCYCISLSRFIFGTEPLRVWGTMEFDPKFKTDRLTSGILDFDGGTSTFTCSTQLPPHQGVRIFGTKGRVDMDIPFEPPPDGSARIWLYRGSEKDEIAFDPCDQYTIQGDLFSLAVLNEVAVPTPLEDAVANMRVIDAIVQSAKEGAWVRC